MDYCSSCRRHLNGALVCPGCGAYAPDIAPPVQLAGAATTTSTTAWEPFEAQQPAADTPPVPGDASANAPSGDPGQGPPTRPGRAERRRQLARWKKHRRRAAAGTAIALVGGALTIAALPTDSGKGHASAAAPDPVGPDTVRADEPASSSARPVERATRPPQERSAPTDVPGQPTARVSAPPAAQSLRTPPKHAAQAAAGTPGARHVEPATAAPAPQATSPAPAPSTEAPATSVPAGGDQAQTPPSQPAATSPSQVCLLVLCIG